MRTEIKKREVEILAPGGSYEGIMAAMNCGADAIYTGGALFGARAYADNLDRDALVEIIHEAHIRNKKIYLTVNTLLKQKEIEGQLIPYLLPYYEAGLDAVIVQDFGVFSQIRKHFPDMAVHASTQMTVLTPEFAGLLKSLGAERVVPARELSLNEIRNIKDHVDIEIETFVHGALCYCYSGQCLMSSLIGGRSGNRGRCAQPCRLPYTLSSADHQNIQEDPAYLLSLKDICTLKLIPDMVDAGIDSFKIEGRMKKPEYAALVTQLYKKYTQRYLQSGRDHYTVDQKDIEQLMDLYNRGGFTEGYYQEHNGRYMISIDKPNHYGTKAGKVTKCQGDTVTLTALQDLYHQDVLELRDRFGEKQVYSWTLKNDIQKGHSFEVRHRFKKIQKGDICYRTKHTIMIDDIKAREVRPLEKEPLKGELYLFKDQPSGLTISCRGICVSSEGQQAQQAIKQAVSESDIRRQLLKTGDTPFEFTDLKIHMDQDIFIPMTVIKQLRRDCIDQLQTQMIQRYQRKYVSLKDEDVSVSRDIRLSEHTYRIHVLVHTLTQYEISLNEASVSRIYVDSKLADQMKDNEYQQLAAKSHDAGKEIYLATPYIIRHEDTPVRLEKMIRLALISDGVLIRSADAFVLLKQSDFQGKYMFDRRVYTWNTYAKDFWRKQGAGAFTIPEELNYKELQERDCLGDEMVVYGYLPLMISAQCLTKTTGKCMKGQNEMQLSYLIDRKGMKMPVERYCSDCYNVIYNSQRLMLADECRKIKSLNVKEIRLEFTSESGQETKEMIRLFKKAWIEEKEVQCPIDNYTKGHFRRGVE